MPFRSPAAVLLLVGLLVALPWVLVVLARRPSGDRDWAPEHAVAPGAEFQGTTVTIRGVRNFRYRSATEFEPDYYDLTVDLQDVDSVWYVLTPFSKGWRGPAHSFLSFGFRDGTYLAISVEARREAGESYHLLKGLVRKYELIYVVGDERDLIGLRANHRGEDTYVYPVRATRAGARRVFVEMLERANRLREEPEFYNTVTNNCTTAIVRHVNTVAPRHIPASFQVLLPGYSDGLAHRLGLIDTKLPLPEARARYLVNERARRYADDPDFSLRIREGEDLAPARAGGEE